jgi:hypothetical protein
MKFKKLVTEKRAFLGPQHLIIAQTIIIFIVLALLFWRAALPVELTSFKGATDQKVPSQNLDTESSASCFGAIGSWCHDWHQSPKYVAWKPPPRGNKSCLWNCNNAGVSSSS